MENRRKRTAPSTNHISKKFASVEELVKEAIHQQCNKK
jgi:hypothetical protein